MAEHPVALSPRLAARASFAAAAALALSACDRHHFASPTEAQGPPPFVGPPAAQLPPTPAETQRPTTPRPAPSGPENLSFYKTQDSSDWVSKTFKVQPTYSRVFAVSESGTAPPKVTVGKLDLNGSPAEPQPSVELQVTATVKTLADAAKVARGGDLIVVLPGHYQGFTLSDKPDAGDGSYIHFKAIGAPGQVVIDRPTSNDRNWMIVLLAAHHVIIEGFNLSGSNAPGKTPEGPNAGIFISGDFVSTSKLTHHIALIGNFSHNHKKWGMHTVDSHTVLIQDNLFSGSAMEHGAYISDGSDNYVIRRNVFFDNNASGLQCNVDPLASLEKLKEHPALADHAPYKQNREWALGILKLATSRFGANAFPDGRGFNYIIENNVSNGNGRIGGGAINLAGVRESLIQNNLIYGNLSSGIVEWDNGNPFDAAQVDPGPRKAADVTGPESLPIFGCFSNIVRNNTVLMNVRSRPALLVGNGSWGTRARNNILINDAATSIEVKSTGIWRFDGAGNITGAVDYDGATRALLGLALTLPEDLGMSRARLAPQFARDSDEPWVIIDNGSWKLNPKRPDFRPRAGATLLLGRGDPRELPRADLGGKKRQAADIGALCAE
jgi:hypothetical protein